MTERDNANRPPEEAANIAMRLRLARVEAGLAPAQLSDRSGIDASLILRMEDADVRAIYDGDGRRRYDVYERIADALAIEVVEMLSPPEMRQKPGNKSPRCRANRNG